MTSIDLKTTHSLNDLTSATFINVGSPIFGCYKVASVMGIWDSQVMDGTEYLLKWKSIELTSNTNSDKDRVYVLTRTGSSDDLSGESWSDPNLNNSFDLTSTGRYIQVRIIIVAAVSLPAPYQSTYGNEQMGPTISELTLKGVTSQTSALFYSKTFSLGFYPKSIVISEESDIPDGAILRYGVTSLDSADLDDYQFVDANNVVELDRLSVTGDKIKFVIEMSGSSGQEVTVHEFAAMFSGEGNKRLNE